MKNGSQVETTIKNVGDKILSVFREAGTDAWEELKMGIDKAWEEIKMGIDQGLEDASQGFIKGWKELSASIDKAKDEVLSPGEGHSSRSERDEDNEQGMTQKGSSGLSSKMSAKNRKEKLS